MPAFHIGTLNRYRSAAAKRSKAVRAARQAAASSPSGSAPANTAILACAAAGPNSGSEPSQRFQVSTVVPGWVSAYTSRNVWAIASDSDRSPRGERSESLAIAQTFLDVYADTHPGTTVETWNLWDGSLPEFGPAAAHAKMAVFAGADPEGDQAAAWRAARTAFERFAAADQYLFSGHRRRHRDRLSAQPGDG